MTELSIQSVGVCIDIGTHKVVGMMAKAREDGIIEIVKIASRPSRGIKRGVINNIEPITRIVKDIITELERDLKIDVLSVSASISGSHIRSRKNTGVITLAKDHERFTERDYERILIEAGKLKLDPGESVIHVLPQKYIVDGGEPVENAIGLTGVRFTLIAHLITAATNEITNIRNCIAASDVNVDNVIYEGLSSAISVLTEDERQRGVTLIDIGAGVTDVVVYQEGVVVFHDSIPLGGDDVTADIAKLKRFSTQVAESIKIEHGSCMGYASYDGTFTLPVITNQSENRKMSIRELSFIIDARYREILEFVREKIEEAGVYQLHDAGVVLTGGASQMVGCVELARDVMDKPCRIGLPINVSYKSSEPLTPEHAAVVGLLASYKYENIWQKELQKTMPSGNIFSSIYRKIAGICRKYL